MFVLGTAGHVDHGKSTLVEAITGINPDRLKEEQERQMTIDLGFAWFTLPSGKDVGIVDVPGHRDFIKNMLAGVGGIDAVLLVVAADEGIMPQTKEHLAILDVLGVSNGVVAITKCDQIKDAEWLQLIESDIKELLESTALSSAEVVKVSAFTRQGLDDLLLALDNLLENQPPKKDINKPRLPIDRVFSIKGFGTVVTGTLLDGKLTVGDDVEILPSGIRGRIRGLQTHKQAEEVAIPGSRTAVNITGVDTAQIQRGNVLVKSGTYQISKRIDAQVRMLADAAASISHNNKFRFFHGADEFLARVRVIGKNEILRGESGFAQLELDHPAVIQRGDRFILRRPSPPATIGGGEVLDAYPKSRYKRFQPSIQERFETLMAGSEKEILLDFIDTHSPINFIEATQLSGFTEEEMKEMIEILLTEEQIYSIGSSPNDFSKNPFFISRKAVERAKAKILSLINTYHLENPIGFGLEKPVIAAKSSLAKILMEKGMNELLDDGMIIERNGHFSDQKHRINLTEKQKKSVAALIEVFEKNPYMPPSKRECLELVGPSVFQLLIDQGKLLELGSGVILRKEEFDQMREYLIDLLRKKTEISLAELRDHFQTSRKYALAFLEKMDAENVTERRGDVRVMKNTR